MGGKVFKKKKGKRKDLTQSRRRLGRKDRIERTAKRKGLEERRESRGSWIKGIKEEINDSYGGSSREEKKKGVCGIREEK